MSLQQSTTKPRKLDFADAVADHSEESWKVAGAIDPSKTTGWGVWDGVNNTAQDRQAVFRLKQPVEIVEGSILVVTLRHQSRFKEHLLGHFRISATDTPRPGLDTATVPPADILELVRKQVPNLKTGQLKRLSEYHRKTTDASRRARRLVSINRAARQRHEGGMIE